MSLKAGETSRLTGKLCSDAVGVRGIQPPPEGSVVGFEQLEVAACCPSLFDVGLICPCNGGGDEAVVRSAWAESHSNLVRSHAEKQRHRLCQMETKSTVIIHELPELSGWSNLWLFAESSQFSLITLENPPRPNRSFSWKLWCRRYIDVIST